MEVDFQTDQSIVRVHKDARFDLFSPIGCKGAPSIRNLHKERITIGKYCDNGEEFHILDRNFKRLQSGCNSLNRPWTGQTVFKLKPNAVEKGFNLRAVSD